ncbi:YopX family protein [Chryseobacterium sp. M5A1_1a]
MREIKFRAFSKELNQMSKPFSFNQVVNFNDKTIKSYNPNTECIMQYTGLNDKNGVEIYDGDIMESEHESYLLIVFRYGSWTLVHKPSCGTEIHGEPRTDSLFQALKVLNLEIIGNIHENPKLLSI